MATFRPPPALGGIGTFGQPGALAIKPPAVVPPPAATPASTGEALTLDALMARQKEIAQRQGGAMEQQVTNIPQGLSQLAWTAVNALQQRRTEKELGQANAEVANAFKSLNMETGDLPPEAIQTLMTRNPEVGMQFIAEMIKSRRERASQENWVDIPTPEGETGQWQQNTVTNEKQRKGSSGVNINTGGEGEFEKKVAAQQAETFSSLYKDSLQAAQDEISVGELENIFKTAGTGTSAGMRVWAKQKLGLELGDDVNDLQAADAIISRLVPAQRPAGSGTMSDKDIALFRSSLPSIWNQPGGNEKIMRTMKGIIQYRKAQGLIASAVMNGQMSREEGFQKLMAIPNPLADLNKPEETEQPPAGGTGTPAETEAPQDVDIPTTDPEGTEGVGSDGNNYIVKGGKWVLKE
jgi:hypothetical protein